MKVLLFLLLAFSLGLNAQNDSLVVKQEKDSVRLISPKKASLYSLLPGAGQIYVGKLWYVKVPIIYGGITGIGMAIDYNHKNYIKYRNEYRNRLNYTTYVSSGELSVLSDSAVKNRRDDFRRYRDMNYMLMAAWYGLNILEASVSAHLSQFDVSDDLSLKIQPFHQFEFDRTVTNGLQFKLTF